MLQPPPLSLYVHLPWCVRKCPYCDFNSHRSPATLPDRRYVDALVRDLDYEARTPETRPVETVFFGGGTPSLFPPAAFARILEAIGERWRIATDAEVSMEANPGTVEHAPFDEYLAAGVNRVSLGVQSFDDDALARIGRIHDGHEALRAVRRVMQTGFDSVNIDLMYGLPEQSVGAAVADVEQALDCGPAHLSHYHLTIEPNTLFASRRPSLPDDDDCWAIQLACQEIIAKRGYEHYEVSAYARPDSRCRHNLNYWQFGDYLGVGAGAHGKLTRENTIRRTLKQRHPTAYMESAGRTANLMADDPVLPEQRLFEFALNAFRLREGFTAQTLELRTGLYPKLDRHPWTAARDAGLLDESAGRIRASDKGWDHLNALVEMFLP